ncbi:MAG: DUF4129 domain-containing protein [Ktedonobacterales bacterium]
MRWWSNKTLRQAITAGMLLLLELLPVQAWLLLFAAANGDRLGDAPISPAVNAALLLGAWALGQWLRPRPAAFVALVAGAGVIAGYAFVLTTSPGAYAGINPLPALASDLSLTTPRLYAVFGLLPLTIFIFWRGYATGRTPPGVDATLQRFKFGLVAVLVVVIAATTLKGSDQGALLGALAIILPLEVYCGLVASALARLAREQLRPGAVGNMDMQGPWLRAAMGLAGVIVGFALLFSVIVNAGSVGALLGQLGPVGAMLSALATLLTNAIGEVLYLLFNGIVVNLHGKVSVPKVSVPRTPVHCVPSAQNHFCVTPGAGGLPPFWLHLAAFTAQAIFIAVILAIGIYLLRRFALSGRWRTPPNTVVDERREALDGGSLFGTQLRALLDGLRPRRAPYRDPLTPGTVRYLYRDVLRAADRAGIARAPGETPDEYAARLATAAPLASGSAAPVDMDTLSDAYTAARYGEREPRSGALDALRDAARRVMDALRRQRT